ncbi:MAG: radical SAM/SPASM domain-containing protein [Patescibacteria group bacterium]
MELEQVSPFSTVDANKHLLRFLWLEITKRCNLACRHCYRNSSPKAELLGTMTDEDWIRLIHEAKEVGCTLVQFIGGEPLVHPSFSLLLQIAHGTGMNVEVFTNATLVEDDVADLFSKYGTRVAVSVYADDPVTHDRVTSHKGSHSMTEKAICRLVDRGIDLRVGIIEQGENSDIIEQTVEYVRRLGVQNVGTDHIRAVGRGVKVGSTGWQSDPMAALCGQCHKARLAVDINGDAFPCVLSNAFPVGNIRNGLLQVLSGKRLENFRQNQQGYKGNPCNSGCSPDDQRFPRCKPNCVPKGD